MSTAAAMLLLGLLALTASSNFCRGAVDADLDRVREGMIRRGYDCERPGRAEPGDWTLDEVAERLRVAKIGAGGTLGARGREVWIERGWGEPEDLEAMTVLADGTVCMRLKNETELGFWGKTGRKLARGLVEGDGVDRSTVGVDRFGRVLAQSPDPRFGEEPGLPSTSGGRVRVPVEVSADEPFKMIGQVGSFCSGALVGKCHYLTAGHCVWDPDTGRFSAGVNFNPGRNGQEMAQPLGRYQALQVYSSVRWTLFGDVTKDAAIVHVSGTPGEELGFMDFGSDATGTVEFNSAGYPGDKPFGEMWFDFCQASLPQSPLDQGGFVAHDCQIYNGSSGSAAWTYEVEGGDRRIVAVVNGALVFLSVDFPFAVFLEGSLLKELKSVIEEMECVS
ncbi:unnamed protein product [Ostreobium quekettii]|uniref:Serine protease n=1 Tax=Ostreobium quekettii TaxID=121088 RepID=A0A8S1J5Q2_9CHLO|nr:unnamed protein product [Ostreobium quekettii]|eukprot:evm.model.scf_6.1 EVM.evm.TU.scf_6.1   scf_6:17846-21561(+)